MIDFMKQWQAEKDAKLVKAKADVPSIMALIPKNVRIDFSGGGDEGSIDDINGLDHGTEAYDTVQQWAYAFLEGVGVDWYNNEGGFGFIELNKETGKVTYEVNVNTSSSELAEGGEF